MSQDRYRLNHMRKLVVDGETWRWSTTKAHDYSEWTPAGYNADVHLRGPDGYLRHFTSDDVTDEKAITPGRIAAFIRSIRKEWPCGRS